MTIVIGNQKQEKKIRQMGQVAHGLFPDIAPIVFKGVFRHGIETSLQTYHYETWSSIARETPDIRSRFFKTVLEYSSVKLEKLGLNADQIKTLVEKLTDENKKFLDEKNRGG